MAKLKPTIESTINDTSSIDSNISSLAAKFLTPIDRLKSIARPALVQSQSGVGPQLSGEEEEGQIRRAFEGIQVNTRRPVESRAHAFYRMLGFPIMAEDGEFYNSGFNPNKKKSFIKRRNINDKIIGGSLQNIINKREIQAEERRVIFAAQDIYSTAYAIALRYTKPFFVMNSELGPMEMDNQAFKVEDRIKELKTFKGDDGEPIRRNFSDGNHILKPFIIDPRIDETVMPHENLICVPFLPTKEDTKISSDKTLLRPGIELILRLRLRDSNLDSGTLREAERILTGKTNQNIATNLRDSVLALVDDNNLNDSGILEQLSSFQTTQALTIMSLIKTMKAVIAKLDDSIANFDMLRTQLNLQPVPGLEGPEFPGGFIRTVGGGDDNSTLEGQIARLKLEQQLELSRSRLESARIGDNESSDIASLFAIPTIVTAKKDFSGPIQKLERIRDQVANQALTNLANIEKITGEVSGLGLIDVLAIYTALWAIDIDTLIGFLDEEAFDRLYKFNPELRTGEVELRKGGLVLDGISVLTTFENKLFNILSFADNLLKRERESPVRNSGGDATQG